MKRRIKKAAVIGSGIMGSGIACHLANIGVEVLLYDIVPKEPNEAEKAKGLNLQSPQVRNRIATEHLQNAVKSNPSPIFSKKSLELITICNMDDDLPRVKEVDWIIEVVVERLDIKKSVFEKLDQFRKDGTLISTNTSSIPIHFMTEGRSEDFKKHFCGTHFFNPPRYLRLLEIIPTPDTSQEVIDFYMDYGSRFLGKTTVLCKDTPAFIANRVGVFSIMHLFHTTEQLGLSVTDVDKLTGPVIGRPKSATFRTCDVVGLDTLIHVANGVRENCPNDEANAVFKIPGYVQKMQDNGWLGSKSGQGFYKKITNPEGKSEILELNLKTLEYQPGEKTRFAVLDKTKSMDSLAEIYNALLEDQELPGEFFRKEFGALFAYVSHRIPEIADSLYQIDDAMRAGFGWTDGPFQIWDAIGVEKGIELAEKEGSTVADWVKEMVRSGSDSFYKITDKGEKEFYDTRSTSYQPIPGQSNLIVLNQIRPTKTLWENKDGVCITDLGDGIINVEFRSKKNTIGAEVIQGLNKALDMAETNYNGVLVANQSDNFSYGANIGMIFMLAAEQEFDELNLAIHAFQQTMMRMRYSSIPVIGCPFNMALGGGCELNLHADKVVASAETYIGLVEVGVGVIPGGGGTKELTMRASDMYQKGDVEINTLQEMFMNIAQAKVSTSGVEAMNMHILKEDRDVLVMNIDRQIAEGKKHALLLSEAGYTAPTPRTDIKVLGKTALGMFEVGIDQMLAGNYISEYDAKIAGKLAYVMSGGDLSEQTLVSEQYLLDLEREAFLSLCGERKTLERIQHTLKTGKPLRN